MLLFSSCQPDKQAHLAYNKSLVGVQSELIRLENVFHHSLENHQLGEMETALFDLREKAIKSKKFVRETTIPGGDDKGMKKALMELCETYHQLCDHQFKEGIALLGIPDGKYSDIQQKRVAELFRDSGVQLDTRNSAFIDAQTSYWKTNELDH